MFCFNIHSYLNYANVVNMRRMILSKIDRNMHFVLSIKKIKYGYARELRRSNEILNIRNNVMFMHKIKMST